MLVKLSAVRVEYNGSTGKHTQLARTIYINPALVQYVEAVQPASDENKWEADNKECADPLTRIGFGVDMEMQVLETLQFVVDSINEEN